LEKEIAVLKPKHKESNGMAANQPLSSEIMVAVLLEPPCISAIKPYAGTIDPIDHLDLFTSHMMV